jgi:hypothetical protein
MGLKDPRVGFNSVTEFMGSGLPWVISGSAGATATRHQFDKVSKRIIIKNHESAGTVLRVGFTENGINGVSGQHYFGVDGGDTFEIDVRIKEIFLKRNGSTDVDYSLFVELTMIDSDMMPLLTGSLNGTTFWEGVG